MSNFEKVIDELKKDSKIFAIFETLVYRGWDVDARNYLMDATSATLETAQRVNELVNAGEIRYYL